MLLLLGQSQGDSEHKNSIKKSEEMALIRFLDYKIFALCAVKFSLFFILPGSFKVGIS